VAFTKPSLIQYLNNLNARSDKNGSIYAIQQKETVFDQSNKRCIKPPIPREVFRAQVKEQLEQLLVSIKAKNKVTTVNRNKIRTKNGIRSQYTATPRAQLHNESVYGSSMSYVTKEEKVNASFDEAKIMTVAKKKHREALLARLQAFGNDAKKAFTGKNTLEKNPIYLDEHQLTKVPEKVRTVAQEQRYTIRKKVDKDLRLDKVVDVGVRRILQERLKQYGNDPAKAFANLAENPIYLNEEKGITIQTVTVTGVSNAVPLHTKKDHFGNLILDDNGKEIPTDFVSPSNNHHVAIYRDGDGNIQESVVSYMEAVLRKNAGLPVVNRHHPEGWELLFTLKQNEFFVFPDEQTGFDPNGIDLLDPANYAEISRQLYRVQKIATRMYYFRHHLETTLDTAPETRNTTWRRVQTPSGLIGAVKLRLDVLGRIVSVGEYW
jgi:CRISPR-associated endonuclease Csn1